MKIAESAKSSLEQIDHLPAISWEDWLGMCLPPGLANVVEEGNMERVEAKHRGD
jgi:hypothetical protein